MWQTEGQSEESSKKAFDVLHGRYSQDMLDIILKLKGFYIKIGQTGSTRGDFVPPAILDKISTLQDGVPGEDFAYIRETVEKELGRPLSEVFSEFREAPLGAASIGQTHFARLKDGTEVCVKVQYPHVERLFRTDMETIRSFCELAQPAHVPLLNEIQKSFMTEFDYAREAENLKEVSEHVARSPYSRSVVVPKPISGLCTKRVLVMEFLPGKKLVEGIKDSFAALAASQGKTLEELQREHRAPADAGKGVARGASAWQMDLYGRYLGLRDALVNTPRAVWNCTGGLIPRWRVGYVSTPKPLNMPRIIDLLLQVHGHSILVDGIFSGDPHPGNILLLPDGRLGLIDFGQTKRITAEHRKNLSKLILALAREDKEEACRMMDLMGFKTEKGDPYVVWKSAQIFFDKDDLSVTEGLNIQLFVEKLDSIDKVVKTGDDYVLAGRAAMLLRGLGTLLNYPVSIAQAWKGTADKVLKEEK